MKMPPSIAIAPPFLLVCACSPEHPAAVAPATSAAVAEPSHSDPLHGFAIAIPADMQLRHDFRRSYLGDAAWKAFAQPDSHGTPVAALVLNGSNAITAAELRIGIGTDASALAHCRDMPAGAASTSSEPVMLAGTSFIRFHAADAAMSHYLEVESYRGVHAGRCYAIDLLLTGTRPEVYDPPAMPPFEHAAAWRKLRGALAGFRLLK